MPSIHSIEQLLKLVALACTSPKYASTGPDGEGGPTIKLYQPFTNGKCMQCHSTSAKKYVETHGEQLEQIRSGDLSCIDCHSEVHPTALSRRAPVQKAEAK